MKPTMKKTAPIAIQSITLTGIDGCDFDAQTSTLKVRIATRQLRKEEEEMLADLFPHHHDDVLRMLRRETLLAAIK